MNGTSIQVGSAAVTGSGEIIGDLAQSTLIARAVEPTHGEGTSPMPGADGHIRHQACLNCGTLLTGRHCHACGQSAHVHKTIGAFFHDLLHGVFHFEGKIWRTLPLLAWRPGKLTREYVDGRRASYVSPIALFLFVVFLTFALFNALGNPIDFNNDPKAAAEALTKADQAVAELEMQKADAEAKGDPIPGIDGQIDGAKAARDVITIDRYGPSDSGTPSAAELENAEKISSIEALNTAWRKAKQNPELLIYKLQSNAYKYSWLLIPLSLPFVWLLFPFSRRFGLYDHIVFVTYSLSFMLLLIAGISLVALSGLTAWLIVPAVFYAPFHMYRQLRETYQLSRFSAWWRTWPLSFSSLIVLVLFAVTLTSMVAMD